MLDDLLQGHVLLTDEDGHEEEYQVLRVLEMTGRHYVLLQSELNRGEEPLILRVLDGAEGGAEPALAGIDDDDEWESVAEAFDELMFELDDQS